MNTDNSDDRRLGESRQPTHHRAASYAHASRPRFRSLVQQPVPLGPYSTAAIPNSLFFSDNFMLGVGMLIIQPETGKVVIVNDSRYPNHWFFPKGRKDAGEDLREAVLREAYEESGYRATLMPLPNPTQAPPKPGNTAGAYDLEYYLNTEPIFVSTYHWTGSGNSAGIYFTFWYVGEIPTDAVRHTGTGMPDEQHYVSHLVDVAEAYEKLASPCLEVLNIGYTLWQRRAELLVRRQQQQSNVQG